MADKDLGALPSDRATAAEPVVSALRDGIPSAVKHIDAVKLRAALAAQQKRAERQRDSNFIAPIFSGIFSAIIDAVDLATVAESDAPESRQP